MNIFRLASIFLIKSAGKEDILKDKFPEHANLIDQLSKEDPSESSKYLEWMLKQAIAGFNLSDIIPLVKYFHNNQHEFKDEQRDINHYKTAKDLENLIKSIEFNKYDNDGDKGESENVFGDLKDRFTVIRPDNKDACIYYGKKTHWCITMRNAEHYEDYTSTNIIFYFIIDKLDNKNSLSKIAYAIYRDEDNKILDYEIFDINDKLITDAKVREYMGEDEFVKVLRVMTTDSETRDRTINYNDKRVREATARLAKDSERQWKYYNERGYKSYLAVNKNLSKELQMLLLEKGYYNGDLASNTGIDKEVQLILFNDEDYTVKTELAANPSVDKEIQLMIIAKGSINLRAELARNPVIDKETQLLLFELIGVDAALAENPSIDREVQLILFDVDNINVKYSLAENPSTIKEIRMKLAIFDDKNVRRALAKNPSIDKEVQLILSKDNFVKTDLAQNPSIDNEIRLILVKNGDEFTRRAIARSPLINKKIQIILANDPEKAVRDALLENTKLLPEAKRILLSDTPYTSPRRSS